MTVGKLDLKVQKHTYIDQIIQENCKKNFPKPGPSDHFMDDAAIKKFCKENLTLFKRKNQSENKKTNLP